MADIEILAGDFKAGKRMCELSRDRLLFEKSWFKREEVALTEIDTVEIVSSEDAVKRAFGAAAWGVAGSLLLGPAGFLAGALARGLNKKVMFACHLKDGRKFLGVAREKTYTALTVAAFK